MATSVRIPGAGPVADRDTDLRQAHRRAFGKIQAAVWEGRRDELVAEAVSELIDACEAYIQTRH